MLILTGQGTPGDDIASEEVALGVNIHAALALVTAKHCLWCPHLRHSDSSERFNIQCFVFIGAILFLQRSSQSSLYLALEAVQTSVFGQSVPYIQTA